MLRPSIFGESLFDTMMDFPMDLSFWGNEKNPLYGKNTKNIMKTDIREKEDTFELDIDLPGFQKEEIKARLDNGYLTIEAAKGLDKEEKDHDGRLIRQERYTGQCARSFYIGTGFREEDISARFENGILNLTIPKKDNEAIGQRKQIAIEG